MRALVLVLLFLLLGVCGLGLLATLEPTEPSSQLFWRSIYGAGALVVLILIVRSIASLRGARSSK